MNSQMVRAMKVIVPVLIVAVALGVVQLYRQLQLTQQQFQHSQQDVARLTSEKEALEREFNDLQVERKNLEERLSSLRSQLSSTTSDLEHARVKLQETDDRLTGLTKERDALQAQLASTTGERDDLQKQIARLKRDNEDLDRAAMRVRERLILVDRDYRQLSEKLAALQAAPNSSLSVVSSSGPTASLSHTSEGNNDTAAASTIPGTVELPPVVVRKDHAMMATPMRMRLMEVNEQHNFVIMDKGSDDGVRLGMVFDVVRGTGTVGSTTVVRVRPHLVACDIIRAKTPGPLQVGDLAVQSSP